MLVVLQEAVPNKTGRSHKDDAPLLEQTTTIFCLERHPQTELDHAIEVTLRVNFTE